MIQDLINFEPKYSVAGAFGGLDLHGNDVTTVWCRLAETASAGSAELLLNEQVDWREGSTIS